MKQKTFSRVLKTPPKNSNSELWRSFSFLLSFEQTELESLIWDLVSQKSKQMFGRVGRMQQTNVWPSCLSWSNATIRTEIAAMQSRILFKIFIRILGTSATHETVYKNYTTHNKKMNKSRYKMIFQVQINKVFIRKNHLLFGIRTRDLLTCL